MRADLGLDAGDVVEVLLERAGTGGVADGGPIAFIERCHAEQRRGVMATVFRSTARDVSPGARLSIVAGGSWSARGLPEAVRPALAAECVRVVRDGGEPAATTSVSVAGATLEVLVETVRPAPRLFVIGGGEDAAPLVDIAHTVGWETVVCVPRGTPASPERFVAADAVLTSPLTDVLARIDASERALAVVMSHDYARDRDALGMLLVSRARYIGVVGPERRTARMLDDLGCADDALRDPRLHAPVGLGLCAESPGEVALAIAAEMQGVLTRSGALNPGPRAPSQFAD